MIKPPENVPPSAADADVAIEAGTVLSYDLEPLVEDADGPREALSVEDVRFEGGSEGVTFERSGWNLELEADIARGGDRRSLSPTRCRTWRERMRKAS